MRLYRVLTVAKGIFLPITAIYKYRACNKRSAGGNVIGKKQVYQGNVAFGGKSRLIGQHVIDYGERFIYAFYGFDLFVCDKDVDGVGNRKALRGIARKREKFVINLCNVGCGVNCGDKSCRCRKINGYVLPRGNFRNDYGKAVGIRRPVDFYRTRRQR